MNNLKYYFLAFILMSAIYGVEAAGIGNQVVGAATTLKHRTEQLEQALEIAKSR